MSTRATYEFKDKFGSFTVYKHYDGNPSNGLMWIAESLKFAWPLPRFEACEFAAAFVAANKELGGGDVYLSSGRNRHADTNYHYIVQCYEGVIYVDIENCNNKMHDQGTLDTLLNKYEPTVLLNILSNKYNEENNV